MSRVVTTPNDLPDQLLQPIAKADGIHPRSVDLVWTTAECNGLPVEEYAIEWHTVEDNLSDIDDWENLWGRKTVAGASTGNLITGLHPGLNFTFRIKCCNALVGVIKILVQRV